VTFISHSPTEAFSRPVFRTVMQQLITRKVKAFPYPIPSTGPGADPGVQAVSPQVTVSHPPGGRLPLLSARPAVTLVAYHCFEKSSERRIEDETSNCCISSELRFPNSL